MTEISQESVVNTSAQMQQDSHNAQENLAARAEALSHPLLHEAQSSHHYSEMMDKLNATMGENKQISLNDLMESVGITEADFQKLCDIHPDMLQSFGGGKVCGKLGVQAAKVEGSPHGDCLAGAALIHSKAGYWDLTSLGLNEDAIAFKKERSYQKANGGEVSSYILEKTGNYVTVSMKNPCYGESNERHTPEYNKMNEFMSGIQPGITMTVDSISDNQIRRLKGDTEGGKYGHVAVASNTLSKNGERVWACDGRQTEFNFSRYGENIHLCFPKDCTVPRGTAEMLTKIAADRRDMEEPQMIRPDNAESMLLDTISGNDLAMMKLKEGIKIR